MFCRVLILSDVRCFVSGSYGCLNARVCHTRNAFTPGCDDMLDLWSLKSIPIATEAMQDTFGIMRPDPYVLVTNALVMNLYYSG